MLKAVLLYLGLISPTTGTIPDFGLYDHTGSFQRLYYYSNRARINLISVNSDCLKKLSQPQLDSAAVGTDLVFLIFPESASILEKSNIQHLAKMPSSIKILVDDTQEISRLLGFKNCGDRIDLSPRKGWVALNRNRMPSFSPDPITYSNYGNADYESVAQILIKKCAHCHHEGGIAPWSMDNYTKIKGWSPMIKEVLLTKRMPPWGHNWNQDLFLNSWGLTTEELKTIYGWINEGSRSGHSGVDPLLVHSSKRQTQEGKSSKPDFELTLPVHEISNKLDNNKWIYEDFEFGFDKDRWISAAQIIPSDPETLHHAYLFIDYPKDKKSNEPNWDYGWNTYFASFFKGIGGKNVNTISGAFSPGTAKLIPKNAKGRIQIHYIPKATVSTNQLKISLRFAHSGAVPLYGSSIGEGRFNIPPGAEEYLMTASRVFRRGIYLREVFTHMHYRGKWIRLYVKTPGSDMPKEIFSLPIFRHDWQVSYQFKKPVFVPAGSEVIVKGAFDNSSQNPLNPDPTAAVRFGFDVKDEMFLTYLFYTYSDK